MGSAENNGALILFKRLSGGELHPLPDNCYQSNRYDRQWRRSDGRLRAVAIAAPGPLAPGELFSGDRCRAEPPLGGGILDLTTIDPGFEGLRAHDPCVGCTSC
jgi:hypothetical protein